MKMRRWLMLATGMTLACSVPQEPGAGPMKPQDGSSSGGAAQSSSSGPGLDSSGTQGDSGEDLDSSSSMGQGMADESDTGTTSDADSTGVTGTTGGQGDYVCDQPTFGPCSQCMAQAGWASCNALKICWDDMVYPDCEAIVATCVELPDQGMESCTFGVQPDTEVGLMKSVSLNLCPQECWDL